MSRMYEMAVEIKDYKANRLKRIIHACREEWNFVPDDFTRERTDPMAKRYDKVIATAEGSLCGGEDEREFADRLARAVWKANGEYCHVVVRATNLENMPYETYSYDEDDYQLANDCRKG